MFLQIWQKGRGVWEAESWAFSTLDADNLVDQHFRFGVFFSSEKKTDHVPWTYVHAAYIICVISLLHLQAETVHT